MAADRRPQTAAGRGASWPRFAALGVGALVLVSVLGGAGWYFLAGPGAAPASVNQVSATNPAPAAAGAKAGGPASGATSPPTPSAGGTREQVAAFVKTQPPSVAAFAEAERLAKAGTVDGAFLLYRYAADKGHTPSMIAIGKMYDPTIGDAAAQKFVRPSAETAAGWYKRAAAESESQWLLGKLMLKGGPDLPADKAAAKEWLQKAAAAGNGEAKQLLSSLD
jgi:hypothetical protein